MKVSNINSELLMCRKFTLNFSTTFVGSLNIRASREAYPTEVKSPEIERNNYFMHGFFLLLGFETNYLVPMTLESVK